MSLARKGGAITLVGLVLLGLVYVRALAYTPVERFQGPAQKIFYLHMPAAVWAEAAMILVGLASIFYLFLKDPRLDRFAAASAEAGTVFAGVVLTTGPIWGKPVWGTWWTWDARLTLTLLLFFLYMGYQLMRGAVAEPGLRARYSAVLGICGLVLVPFIHLSTVLFRTLHPQPIVLKPSAPSLPASMLVTLLLSFGVFTVLYVGFVTQRYALALAREQRGAGGAEGPDVAGGRGHV
jgi:heme exporter protein C